MDRHGIAFGDYRDHLPRLASDFPPPGRIKAPDTITDYRLAFPYCQVCGLSGRRTNCHCHHIMHGMVGRCDSRTNLIILCSRGPDQGCHSDAHGGVITLGHLLYRKWSLDKAGTDWVRLALLRGSFLPDLEVTR